MPSSFVESSTGLKITFTDNVIEKFKHYKNADKEAGGLLFTSNLHPNILIIDSISLPEKSDSRFFAFFKLNIRLANRKIRKMFKSNYQYVGEWHSHPEPFPKLSETDRRTILSVFNESEHNLAYMIHVIIGTQDFDKSFVCLTDGMDILTCDFLLDKN